MAPSLFDASQAYSPPTRFVPRWPVQHGKPGSLLEATLATPFNRPPRLKLTLYPPPHSSASKHPQLEPKPVFEHTLDQATHRLKVIIADGTIVRCSQSGGQGSIEFVQFKFTTREDADAFLERVPKEWPRQAAQTKNQAQTQAQADCSQAHPIPTPTLTAQPRPKQRAKPAPPPQPQPKLKPSQAGKWTEDYDESDCEPEIQPERPRPTAQPSQQRPPVAGAGARRIPRGIAHVNNLNRSTSPPPPPPPLKSAASKKAFVPLMPAASTALKIPSRIQRVLAPLEEDDDHSDEEERGEQEDEEPDTQEVDENPAQAKKAQEEAVDWMKMGENERRVKMAGMMADEGFVELVGWVKDELGRMKQ